MQNKKFRIEYNTNKKVLMIHSFSTNDEKLDEKFPNDKISEFKIEKILENNILSTKFKSLITDYLITFDDGLYQQIKLINLFDKNKVIFFPSFGLLRDESLPPKPLENSFAHINKTTSLSTFMTSTEVCDLMHTGYRIGMHGWYHLDMRTINEYNIGQLENHNQLGESIKPNDRLTKKNFRKFKDIITDIKTDAEKCVNEYYQFIIKDLNSYIMDDELILYFCTPYNCINEYQKLYINFVKDFLDKKSFPTNIPKKIKVFSFERESIEKFIKDNYAII